MSNGFRTPRAYPRGETVNIDTGSLEQDLYKVSLATGIIDARAFGGTEDVNIGPTKEQMITNAIQYAVAVGATAVFVPKSMRPYTASAVTFNSSVLIVTESLDLLTVNVQAYGAKGDNVTDDSVAILAAIAAAVAIGDGTRVVFPTTISNRYLFNQQIAPSKAIILDGGVAGVDNAGQHSGPTLVWTGGASVAILLSGIGATNAQMRGLLIDNTGTGTIAIQVESGGVLLRDIACVSPTVPFSNSGIAISIAGTSTTPNVKLDNVICRGAAPINLNIGRIAGFLLVHRGSFMDPSAGGTISVKLGDAVAGNEARYIHFHGTTFESTTTDLVNVQISRVRQVTFDKCYFEIFGANAVAVDIPNTATVAFAIHLQSCRLGGISGNPYALRSNFASAVLSADNCTLDGTLTGMFNNTLCRHATLSRNKYNSSGLVWASSLKNVTKWGNEQSGSTKVRDDGYFKEKEFSSTTGVSNTLVAETDLITYTLPQNRLYEDQQSLDIEAWGTTAANANGKQVRLYVGGTMVLDSTSLAANAKTWNLRAKVIRNGATTAEVYAEGSFNGAPIIPLRTSVTLAGTGWVDAAGQILKVTGQSAVASTDITQRAIDIYVTI